VIAPTWISHLTPSVCFVRPSTGTTIDYDRITSPISQIAIERMAFNAPDRLVEDRWTNLVREAVRESRSFPIMKRLNHRVRASSPPSTRDCFNERPSKRASRIRVNSLTSTNVAPRLPKTGNRH
jgi:hypothetical protein